MSTLSEDFIQAADALYEVLANGPRADEDAVAAMERFETARAAPEVDPVGLAEITERLGVSRKTADAWRTRTKTGQKLSVPLPEPRWTVGGRPAWNWPDIEAWAQVTGRLDTEVDG